MSNPVNPGTSGPRTEPRPQTPNTTPVPAPTNVNSLLATWLTEVQDNMENRTIAQRVLLDLESVRTGLSGRQLAEWHFVEMHAFMVREDPQACRAARDVKRLTTDPLRVSVADGVLREPSCDP